MGLEYTGKGAIRLQGGGIVPVREEFDAVVGCEGRFFGKLADGFVFIGQSAGCDLARLDIGLVEGVDFENGTGDGGCDLPQKELLSEIVRVTNGEPHNGMVGVFDCLDRKLFIGVGRALEAEIDEKAIVAVDGRRPERLAIDGDKPFTLLTGRFSDQLLEPRPEVIERRRGDQSQLVASGAGRRDPG